MIRLLKILTIFFLFATADLYAQKSKESYETTSVLSAGKWFKIAITKDAIYRIDFAVLKQLGLENPSNPRIFCNNSGQLSYYNTSAKTDDLEEISLSISGNDNNLNEGEFLLFFGKSPGRWIYDASSEQYNFLRHNYSDTAIYFITSGSVPGKRITNAENPSGQANFSSSASDALFIHEQEDENLIKSGREWFQPISSSRGITVSPDFRNLITTEKINFKIRVAARSSVSSLFRLYEGESLIESVQVQNVNLFNTTGTYALICDSTGTFFPGSESPSFEVRFFNNGETGAKGWIDFIKLHGRKANNFTGLTTQFSDYKSIANNRITEFKIKSQIAEIILWDISDPLNVKKILYEKDSDTIYFKAETDTLKTFIAFTTGNVLIPSVNQTAVPNQDLHSSGPSDMIILTHSLFISYAERLADLHFRNSGLISQVVTTDQVYNEFSGGIPDVVALRNFIRMKYEKQKTSIRPLKYLLLFGDGSYENKTRPPHNPNFIPTYQSLNSNVVVSSFTSDDFYGLLEESEGEAEGTEDIGIGRLPVSDTVQAGIILSKIGKYLNPSNMGEWRNVICLSADDEDGNAHMLDAEGLALIIQDSVPAYNIEKIYLDAFRQTTTVNGQSYPEVNKAITDRINSGCLIFNYTGHGSENGLASERIIKPDDINSWKNGGKLPLFITATCEFSRFDDIDINIITREMTGKNSAGEMILLNSDGGGIALMSTTRVVYSAPNYLLNRNIFDFAFDRDESGNAMRLGDIIRLAKNNSGDGPNKRNFSLLGDPALTLAYPWHGEIITDSINSVSILENTDSLKALSVVTISGHVEDNNGVLFNSFDGIVSPIVFDKESKIKTLANDGGTIMDFNMRNNILFSGKTLVKNGIFSFTFIVPRDIDYSFGNGKISYYANNNEADMNGSYTDLIVGGFSNTTTTDNNGPEIRLFMNDTLFRNGGLTDTNPKLLAIIEDKGGINTTGSGIGHDLTGVLDDDPKRSIVLNNYFENDLDNYMKGRIVYDLSDLDGGSHSFTIKAWDNFNNSSTESILFVVETGGKFILKNLINYPNPFLEETRIIAEHNRPATDLSVVINIFSLNGRIVRIIKTNVPPSGYTLPPIIWDGNDESGNRVGKGIYPYSVIITSGDGQMAKTSGRMIIL